MVGRGGGRACYVTPDLSYDYSTVGGRENRRAKIINGIEKKKKKKKVVGPIQGGVAHRYSTALYRVAALLVIGQLTAFLGLR